MLSMAQASSKRSSFNHIKSQLNYLKLELPEMISGQKKAHIENLCQELLDLCSQQTAELTELIELLRLEELRKK